MKKFKLMLVAFMVAEEKVLAERGALTTVELCGDLYRRRRRMLIVLIPYPHPPQHLIYLLLPYHLLKHLKFLKPLNPLNLLNPLILYPMLLQYPPQPFHLLLQCPKLSILLCSISRTGSIHTLLNTTLSDKLSF